MNKKAESATPRSKSNPARWQRLKDILADALEKTSVEERTAVLKGSCAGDTALLREAEKLLLRDTRVFEEFAEFAATRLTHDERDRIGERIGAYVIVRELGRGGMGAVYLAERADGQFEKRVAIKVLKRGTDTDEVLRRFRIERQILANLEHPNITRLLDAGITTDGLPYVVMEFIEGTPITDFVRRENVDLRSRLRLFLKICSAVDFAHQNQIIHRDIKPANVLVKRDGEPKLLDFGIAKLLSVDSDDDITVAVERRLTPMYAAPEQSAGQPLTTVTDVYSLGALLYELLTTQRPFGTANGDLSQYDVSRGLTEPQLPSHAVTDPQTKRQLEGELDRIVARAMQRDPTQRYSSVADLSEDLERYLNGAALRSERFPAAVSAGKIGRGSVNAGANFHHRWYIAAALLLIVGVVAAFVISKKSANSVSILPKEKSIAVLPLVNESGDPRDEYFSDGLSEELIAALAQIKGLKVIGRSSSFRFKDRKEDPKTIGGKLGVSTLLEGTVRKQGDRVRIVAELVNAADGIELWTRTFDRELRDIFAVEEEIARAVAESLKVTLLGSGDRSAQMPAPTSVDAHNAYLQGHFYLQRRNLEDYRKAVSYFDEAIRLDPNYALAYAERSEAWTFIGDLSPEQKKEAWKAAKNDAEKAVAVGPNLAEAHAALGWVRFFSEWKFAEGLRELRRAYELAPENATANDLLARVLFCLGEIEEAKKLARQAIELDPLAFLARGNLARILLVEGELDEANTEARKAAELQPTGSAGHRWQVLAAVLRGDGETALREAELEPDEGYRRFELALAHYARGDWPAADAALAEMIANDRNLLAYQIAEVYAWRGETGKAFEWLQISFDNHDTGILSLLIDPLMRGVRNDPRYKSLLAKLALPAPS